MSATDREMQISAGTVLVTARELAPRIGFTGATGWRRVMSRVRARRIPCVMVGNKPRFHWPTVISAITARRKV